MNDKKPFYPFPSHTYHLNLAVQYIVFLLCLTAVISGPLWVLVLISLVPIVFCAFILFFILIDFREDRDLALMLRRLVLLLPPLLPLGVFLAIRWIF